MSGAASKAGWKVFGTLSAVLAAVVTRRAITFAWTRATGRNPPTNPASPSTTWAEALGWAAVSGVAVAVARLAATRKAASTWHRASGRLPPGLEEVSP